MQLSIIAAMSRNRVIGKGGAIPWSIPADMKRFRELTLGHTLIMGRKTFESIGRPLSGRKSIVVTRQADYFAKGAITAASLSDALCLAEGDGEVFVCGGSDLYKQALPFAGRIYLTVVDLDIEGDTLFPLVPFDQFVEAGRERISLDPPADFIVMKRTVFSNPVSAG